MQCRCLIGCRCGKNLWRNESGWGSKIETCNGPGGQRVQVWILLLPRGQPMMTTPMSAALRMIATALNEIDKIPPEKR